MSKLLFPLVLLGTAVCIFYLFIDPTYAEIQVLKENQAEYALALQNAEKLSERLKGLQVDLNRIPPDQMERLRRLIPDHVDNVRLILELDNLADAHGMEIKNISILEQGAKGAPSGTQQPDGGAEVRSVQAHFSIAGTYEEITNYLKDLQKNVRLVDIESVKISAGSIEGADGVYQYEINLDTYWINYQ